MGKKRSKKPKYKEKPTTNKIPKRIANPDDFYSQTPSWLLSKVHFSDPYGWHEVDRKTLHHIISKLSSFESMRWREILIDARKQNHQILVQDICPKAQKHLKDTQQDDIDEVLSLRLSAKERVWGILKNGVVHLLWWDPNHKIYPSKKKHT